MRDSRLPEYVVAFFGEQHLPFRESQAKHSSHEERQRVGTVVDTPFPAYFAAFVDCPLHLYITRGAGTVRCRQEMAHQPPPPVSAILRGVAAGHSSSSQHSLFSRLTVTPIFSLSSLSNATALHKRGRAAAPWSEAPRYRRRGGSGGALGPGPIISPPANFSLINR
jgi:hypothetical protein